MNLLDILLRKSNWFDTLRKIKRQNNPDVSVTRPVYHLSENLDKAAAKLKGETDFTEFVSGITYNPKGQLKCNNTWKRQKRT